MQHCLVSVCNLCLLKNCQHVTFKKGLCNRKTWGTFSNILALKYCGEATLELDPLLRSFPVKERYRELVDG
eukprot:13845588-Ditylum_brightwellii.AAC.1